MFEKYQCPQVWFHLQAPMVNAKIRKVVRVGYAKVVSIGSPMNLTYDHQHLGIRS
jgi:NADH dehydrogenase (ubiquinone) Fe-S protein 1